ncbi:MAG: tetratricopeptide repeat protein [Nitrospiria bacterium]
MNPYLYMQQGNQAFSNKDYGSALRYYKKALEGIRDDENPLADLYGNIGNVYAATGNIDEAVRAYKEAMSILRRLEDYDRLGITYVNIGNLYADRGKLEEGIDYYKQGALLLERQKKWGDLAVLYGNISLALRKTAKWKAALRYAKKGWALAKKLKQPNILADATHLLAKAEDGAGAADVARLLSQTASSIYLEIGDEFGYAATRYHQASLLEKNRERAEAIRILKEVIAVDEKYNLPKLEKNKKWLMDLEKKYRSSKI